MENPASTQNKTKQNTAESVRVCDLFEVGGCLYHVKLSWMKWIGKADSHGDGRDLFQCKHKVSRLLKLGTSGLVDLFAKLQVMCGWVDVELPME